MNNFFENPILNSPYAEPKLHHELGEDGQPTDNEPKKGRRPSSYISPLPKTRKRRTNKGDEEQGSFVLDAEDGISSAAQKYKPTLFINDIRSQLKSWRANPNQDDWGVTPVTVRLLRHWRSYEFRGVRPFFCQIEAVETIIWLTEVNRSDRRKKDAQSLIWRHIEDSNELANPDLIRLAMKMATGTGKTTVMAMLIAWQTLNAIRYPSSKLFTKGFLIVTPGITIKDRLRVLSPSDPESYYKSRELVPSDMLRDIHKAKIVVTNFHSFQRRELLEVNETTRFLLQGRDEKAVQSRETEGQMVRRVARELMGMKNIVVMNDEAHHCYREKPAGEGGKLSGDEKKEAEENNKAARLWISGIDIFKRILGVRGVYDLSATPFFLSGSGWAEGTLFPWTVSDFSLIDAIESGVVKLPRIPVDDNLPGEDMPIFRDLWKHIGKDMPKKGRLTGDPQLIPDKLKTALNSLYGHYKKTWKAWERAGIDVPPVFIVVCSNTTTSKLVYEWISGWQRLNEDKDLVTKHEGHLDLFRNFDEYGEPLSKPNTLLIDSRQIESGGDLDMNFKEIAAKEIEIFKRERRERGGSGEISDSELLREVMNTVGKQGRLGEHIRCVVSVSMLTEGWDANTVTHILGVRAFGTQLLCEQVVGRALRRLSYEVNENDMFESEYADILGIPFHFTARPVVALPKPPKKMMQVSALRERAGLEIRFPRVIGYRFELPEEHLKAEFTESSIYEIEHDKIGASQTDMAGIVGKEHRLLLKEARDWRSSTISFHLAKGLIERHYRDEDGEPKWYLMSEVKEICRRWIDEGYLKCPGETAPWMLICYSDIMSQACERIASAIIRAEGSEKKTRVMIDSYHREGSTSEVNFTTTKDVRLTSSRQCHVNYVVLDSDWESEFVRVVEGHLRVVSYVKNQGLGFFVPYKDGDVAREYIPDFIVRLDDGGEDLLNVVVEIKGGFVDGRVSLKKSAIEGKWLPGVNALGIYGRWAFCQFESVFDIDKEFREWVEKVVNGSKI